MKPRRIVAESGSGLLSYLLRVVAQEVHGYLPTYYCLLWLSSSGWPTMVAIDNLRFLLTTRSIRLNLLLNFFLDLPKFFLPLKCATFKVFPHNYFEPQHNLHILSQSLHFIKAFINTRSCNKNCVHHTLVFSIYYHSRCPSWSKDVSPVSSTMSFRARRREAPTNQPLRPQFLLLPLLFPLLLLLPLPLLPLPLRHRQPVRDVPVGSHARSLVPQNHRPLSSSPLNHPMD